MCFVKKNLPFFFLTLISVHIGPIQGLFWTESDRIGKINKKIKIDHKRVCSRVHDHTARLCIRLECADPIGTPMLSSYADQSLLLSL